MGKKDLAINSSRVWASFFAVIFAFFAAIAQAAFTVVNCVPNPSNTWTLSVDRSINCFDADWIGLLIVGLLAILAWCVGFGLVFFRAIWVAPKYWASKDFRLRWKFLFVKFRPDCFFFSLIIVIKGVVTNVGFIFLSEPVLQIYWTVACFAIYCYIAATWSPWRSLYVNAADVCAHFSLIFLGFMMTWFLERSPEMDNTVMVFSIAVSFFAAIFSGIWSVRMIVVQVSTAQLEKRAASHKDFRSALENLINMDRGRYDRFMDNLIDFDHASFRSVASASVAVTACSSLRGSGRCSNLEDELGDGGVRFGSASARAVEAPRDTLAGNLAYSIVIV